MNEYMMIFRNEKNDGKEMPTAEQMNIMVKQWQSWISGIAAKGKFSGTNRLLPEGKTIKPGMVITDGPFADAKEVIGGYLIVKANSLNEAIELAKGCPGLLNDGIVEVRTVMAIDDNPKSENFLNEKAVVA
jgi:hypothetical protein